MTCALGGVTGLRQRRLRRGQLLDRGFFRRSRPARDCFGLRARPSRVPPARRGAAADRRQGAPLSRKHGAVGAPEARPRRALRGRWSSARTHAAAGPSTRSSSFNGCPSAPRRGPGTQGRSTSGPGWVSACQAVMASITEASRTRTACSHSPSSRSASSASRRLVRTKSASGPRTTPSPKRARAFNKACAAGASPTCSRSSSLSASRRASSCDKRRLGLPAGRARAHLLFVQRGDVPTCMLECLDRSHRGFVHHGSRALQPPRRPSRDACAAALSRSFRSSLASASCSRRVAALAIQRAHLRSRARGAVSARRCSGLFPARGQRGARR